MLSAVKRTRILTYRIVGAVEACLASEHKEERQMALLLDPFDALSSFQQALDAYRTSSGWIKA